MKINFVKGDITKLKHDGMKLIVHCCNDQGAWGAGFTKALDETWPVAGAAYRIWSEAPDHRENPFKLGSIQVVPVNVEEKIAVVNLIGQHRYGKLTSPHYPFIRYDAIKKGFKKVAKVAKDWEATIHMPRIGCGLAGGKWEMIEELIACEFSDIEVFIYDLE